MGVAGGVANSEETCVGDINNLCTVQILWYGFGININFKTAVQPFLILSLAHYTKSLGLCSALVAQGCLCGERARSNQARFALRACVV